MLKLSIDWRCNMFAGVVINKKTTALNRIFHYQVPEGMPVQVGQVVEVEFGRQKLEAIVIELVESIDYPAEKTKPLLRILNLQQLFGRDLLELSQFAADYYLCSRAAMLQAMLPAGMYLTGRMPRSFIVRRVSLLCGLDGDIVLRGEKQRRVVEVLRQVGGSMPFDELAEKSGASAATIRGLAQKGVVEITEETDWDDGDTAQILPKHELTEAQRRVLAEIKAEFNGEARPVLLYGVTGSGKTEIYLRLAEEVLERGEQVIVLVPEIALTPQTVRVFQQRFGSGVAVLHSGLSAAERRQAWLGIASGQYRMVIGARSAIFAPVPKLGLIVMDEEHEESYRQDNAPRFHTRVLAEERCRLTGAKLILGSATPDIESYYKARRGVYALAELPERVSGRLPAKVQLVDMSQEFRQGNNSVFSRALQQKLMENLRNGGQSLLFLNRRGYQSFVSCRSCGYVVECPHCSVSMAYHTGEEVLKCHYCGQTAPLPKRCPNCGSAAIRYFGAGTQMIVEAVHRLLPGARVARLDRDSTSERGSYERIYRAMLAGEIDVLVGTQMIAKGLDFPDLTLVGVIAADMALNMPDMKSGERAFQLTTQVAGRSGRHRPGEVIVQTYQPGSDILQAACHQDYREFYQREILRRKLAGYPPFAYLLRIIISAGQMAAAVEVGRNLAWHIQQQLEPEQTLFSECMAANMDTAAEGEADGGVIYWGPKPCPRAKIKDRHRLQIILKGRDLDRIRSIAAAAVEKVRLPHDCNLVLDVEPSSIY